MRQRCRLVGMALCYAVPSDLDETGPWGRIIQASSWGIEKAEPGCQHLPRASSNLLRVFSLLICSQSTCVGPSCSSPRRREQRHAGTVLSWLPGQGVLERRDLLAELPHQRVLLEPGSLLVRERGSSSSTGWTVVVILSGLSLPQHLWVRLRPGLVCAGRSNSSASPIALQRFHAPLVPWLRSYLQGHLQRVGSA